MLTLKELWNVDLEINESVKKYFSSTPMSDHFKLIPKNSATWTLPVFLYSEEREPQNYLRTFSLHAGSGSKGAISSISGGRGIIDHFEFNKYMDEKCRGIVLEAFCKIEFCLDACICIEMGAYHNKLSVKDIRDDLHEEAGLFSTTNKKIKYLRQKNFVKSDTYTVLRKAKGIRNALAHQFLVSDETIPTTSIDEYGSWQETISIIFNNGWCCLLRDFSIKQEPILKWLQSNSK